MTESKSWDRAAPCTYVMVAYQDQLPLRTKTSLQGLLHLSVGLTLTYLPLSSPVVFQH